MISGDINQLVEKFYAAETSPEEELQLKKYFQDEEVPAEWQKDKTVFCGLFGSADEVPEGLAERLSKDIDGWNMIEKSAVRKERRSLLRSFSGIAATLLLFVSLGLYLTNRETTKQSYAETITDTYDNPKDALGETERTLTKVSAVINKGLEKINITK